MRNSQRQSHVVFAILMAVLLALPILGLLAGPSTSAGKPSKDPTLADQLENTWKTGLVEGAYLFNKHLNNFDIETEVHGNTAILRGTVSTDTERALAEQVALGVDGIDQVQNELVVEASREASKQDTEQSVGDAPSDAAITTKVRSQLLANPETSGLAIDVQTTDQVVTLKGEVENDVEKELVYYIARNTGGVHQVVNELVVKPETL